MDDEIELGKLLGILWRGKFWIASAAIIALCVGVWYAFVLAVPTYTSSATVALESRQQSVMDIENVVSGLSGDQSTINTEVEVLRSRTLIERLVLNLDLLEDSEFNSWLREPPVFSIGMAVNMIRNRVSGPLPPNPEPTERAILDSVMNGVLRATSVSNVRNSFVFRISVETTSPEKSAAIANHLAELYIDDQIRVKFEKTEQATAWLSERVVELQIALEDAEEELKEFSSNTDLISPEGLIALNRQLKEFRERRDTLDASLSAQKDRIQSLQAALDAEDFQRFVELASDQIFATLLQRSRGSEQEQQELLRSQAIVVMAKNEQDLQRTQNQIAAVERSITDTDARISLQSEELVELQQLQRESEASRLIYEAFLSRLKETSIQQGIQQADSRLLSKAVVATAATAPRKSMILALSMGIGTMIGAGLILLRELSQNTFRVAEDLEAATELSVIGQIPTIPARKRANVVKYLHEKPNSGAAEAIRNLRTSLMLANVDQNPQVIMSTSSIPGEGKTTQSISLAQNFAQLDENVLLIEGDIRRRVFKDYFNITSKSSFLTILAGKAEPKDVIQTDDTLGFDVLIGETSAVNAADLFSSDKFAELIKDLRKTYDRIIIDMPPVLAVPDARVIGQIVDAILYTVKWDSTSHRQVTDGLKSLSSVNIKPTGLVLAQINQKQLKKYGYADTYGQYQGYYQN